MAGDEMSLTPHFKPRTIEFAKRYKFHQVRQSNDSVTSFIARLRKAAKTCNFGADLEAHLRDRFVVGLEDESVVRKLFLEEALTFSKAVQIGANAVEVRGLLQSNAKRSK